MSWNEVGGRRGGPFILLILTAALSAVLTGCGPDNSSATGAATTQSAASAQPTPPAQVSFAPVNGTTQLRLDSPVKVSVKQGTLSSVTVTPSKGTTLAGDLSSDGTEWTSTGALAADMKYTINASAADAGGKSSTQSATFTTLAPKYTADAWIQPSNGSTVGVGMPIIFNLSRGVAEDRRDEVEKGLTVTANPAVQGAFHWFSSRQVQWRPKTFWPSGAKVHVASKLAGIQLDKSVWGDSKPDTVDFTIGSSMISTVNVDKHTMVVRQNGAVIKTIPVTTGRASLATRNGIKVIMSRETTHRMDSETIGIDKDDPDYYNINVKYAMRLTYSGEFIHAAPWSIGSQGRANVSHGCTGMSTANALWMFNHSKMGDVVIYTGSSRKLEWGNGYTAWNMPYSTWAAS